MNNKNRITPITEPKPNRPNISIDTENHKVVSNEDIIEIMTPTEVEEAQSSSDALIPPQLEKENSGKDSVLLDDGTLSEDEGLFEEVVFCGHFKLFQDMTFAMIELCMGIYSHYINISMLIIFFGDTCIMKALGDGFTASRFNIYSIAQAIFSIIYIILYLALLSTAWKKRNLSEWHTELEYKLADHRDFNEYRKLYIAIALTQIVLWVLDLKIPLQINQYPLWLYLKTVADSLLIGKLLRIELAYFFCIKLSSKDRRVNRNARYFSWILIGTIFALLIYVPSVNYSNNLISYCGFTNLYYKLSVTSVQCLSSNGVWVNNTISIPTTSIEMLQGINFQRTYTPDWSIGPVAGDTFQYQCAGSPEGKLSIENGFSQYGLYPGIDLLSSTFYTGSDLVTSTNINSTFPGNWLVKHNWPVKDSGKYSIPYTLDVGIMNNTLVYYSNSTIPKSAQTVFRAEFLLEGYVSKCKDI
ncbi:hypothetical protein HK103_005513 [Boothiomyces macroporosus]|uniref:Transmembrane protein n=1 Tax=Boothiomyces macroporosus TaxID=261099 RepID=A0AAD5UF21_9FUNG|nr:hypothetical protein HK103_005513 [Boothiomyces macroporosus]